MPHLVIEYSSELESHTKVSAMMQAAHDAAVESGLFGVDDIKVRTYGCNHSLVGGKAASSVHITVYLLSGRDQPTQKALAETVLTHMKKLNLPLQSLSVDCRDMDRSVYTKEIY